MKNKLFVLLILLIVPTSVQATEVVNNGFESSTENWSKTASTVLFTLNTVDIKEASHAAEVAYTSTTSNGIKQTITSVTPGQTYKISAYIKSMSAKKAYVRVAWYQDGNSNQLKTDDSQIITPSTEWAPIEFIASAPNQSTSAEIRLLVAEGNALFDLITISEYTEPTATPASINTSLPQPTATSAPLPTTIPTPTITATPSINYQNVYISEAFVYPESNANEWVELYNANSYTVYLTNWYIDDISDGGGTPKSFTVTILPYSYSIVEMTSSFFNNSGDSVQLLDSEKIIKDSIAYTGSQQNKSIGRTLFSNNSVCIQNPSKNKINEACMSVIEDHDTNLTPTATLTPLVTFPVSTAPIPSLALTSVPHVLGAQTRHVTPNMLIPQKKVHENLTNYQNFHQYDINKERSNLPVLATAYSLLSFLSIIAKIIIVRH